MENTAAWHNDNLMGSVNDQTNEKAFSNPEETDSRLIKLVLAGDKVGFEELVDRYKLFAATIAGRYFYRPEQVEEVVQITFTKVYFELKNFRFQPDFSFAGWLGRITTNVCLDTLRSRKSKPEELISELSTEEIENFLINVPNTEKTAENLLVERDLADKLLSSLAPEDQAILQMLYEEEMSVEEIAGITGWSGSKIKIRAFRARKALRKILRRFV